MDKSKPESVKRFLDHIKKPVAICDGAEILQDDEENFGKFLTLCKIPFTPVENLYEVPVDLSKFRTIAFGTTMTYHDEVKKLMQFDKSNLKCVVVFNKTAFHLSEVICKKLKIKLLAFDAQKFKDFLYEDDAEYKDLTKIFYNPKRPPKGCRLY